MLFYYIPLHVTTKSKKKKNKATGYGSDLSKYLYFSLTTEEADEAWG